MQYEANTGKDCEKEEEWKGEARWAQTAEWRHQEEIQHRGWEQVPGICRHKEKEHDKTLEVYREAAMKMKGVTKKQSKPWIGNEIWRKCEEMKEVKQILKSTRSERLKTRHR